MSVLPLGRCIGVNGKRMHSGGKFIGQQRVDPTVSGDTALLLEIRRHQHDLEVGFRASRDMVAVALIGYLEVQQRQGRPEHGFDTISAIHQ